MNQSEFMSTLLMLGGNTFSNKYIFFMSVKQKNDVWIRVYANDAVIQTSPFDVNDSVSGPTRQSFETAIKYIISIKKIKED